MHLSAAIIVKNEEANLPRLLKSIEGKFDEIIVVDTGSTDRTIEIAKEYGCKVYNKEWNGFADARNYAISKCSGDWIWHFDADFELDKEEFYKCMNILQVIDRDINIDGCSIYVKNYSKYGTVAGISSQVFIHRNSEDIKWVGNIHERVMVKQTIQLPVYVKHFGYQDDETRIKKAYRNKELIEKDLNIYKKENGAEYFIKLFYMLQTLAILIDVDGEVTQEAEKYIHDYLQMRRRFLDAKELRFFVYYGIIYVASIFIKIGKEKYAIRYLHQIIEEGFENSDVHFLLAELKRKEGDSHDAKKYLLHALKTYDAKKNFHDNRVIDLIQNIYDFIEKQSLTIFDENDLTWLQKEWKNTRSKTLGLLTSQIIKKYKPQKYEQFMKKLRIAFSDDEWILSFMLLYYNERENPKRLSLAKELHKINPKHYLANRVLAMYYFGEQEYEKALHHIKECIPFSRNRNDIKLLIDILKNLGYEQETQKILQKLKKESKPPILTV